MIIPYLSNINQTKELKIILMTTVILKNLDKY